MIAHALSELALEELRDLAIRADIRIPSAIQSTEEERDFLINQLDEWIYDDVDTEEHSGKTHMHVLRAKFDFFRDTIHRNSNHLREELGSLNMMIPQDAVRFLMRDPSWAYVYWELSPQSRKLVEQSDECILRLYDLSRPILGKEYIMEQSDLSIGKSGDSQYIHLPKKNCWHVVQILTVENRSERVLATSSCIKSIDRFLLDRIDHLLTQPAKLDVTLGGVISGAETLGDNLLVEELLMEIQNRGGKWHE